MKLRPVSYKRHRFPPSVIAHAVWLYFRFPLSLRMVEEMLLERGIAVSYETIRCWAMKFGPAYAGRLRRKAPSPKNVWHLDEVVVTIGGRKHWLWRAVDQDGYVLDEIVQARRNTKAAKRLLGRLMKSQGCLPKRIVTDKLRSYAAARRQLMPTVEHRPHKGLNNRAENSHLLCGNGSGSCSGSVRQERCNASSASSPQSATFSSAPASNAQLSTFTCIALQRWHIGRPSPGQRPDQGECLLHQVNLTSPRRLVGDPSQRSLTMQLRELEADGIVAREVFAEVPPRVEYSLTPFGQTLAPVLMAMRDWGVAFQERRLSAKG